MKTENTMTIENTMTATAKALANLTKYAKGVKTLDKEKFSDLYEKSANLYTAYKVRHNALELSKDIDSATDKVCNAWRDIFTIVGKVNGYNLTVTATTEGDKKRNLFDDGVKYLRKDKNINTSEKLSALILEKSTAVKAIATAKDKRDIDALLNAEKIVKDLQAQIVELKQKSGNCKTIDIYDKPENFAKSIFYCLGLAINNQATMSAEDLKAMRKANNKTRDEKRNDNKKASK